VLKADKWFDLGSLWINTRMTLQNRMHRADGGHHSAFIFQHALELAGAPSLVLLTHGQNLLLNLISTTFGGCFWSPGLIVQALCTRGFKPVEPFVGSTWADIESTAKLPNIHPFLPSQMNKLCTKLHGGCLLPGHRSFP